MVQLYKSLVRPHLEYCSPAWNPHYSKNKAMLERVQHGLTRLFPELRDMMYEARLKALKLWSLEERHNRADLIEVYKMMHGFTDIPVSTYFQIATDSCTRGHTKKLVKSHCHTDARLCFFSLRVINHWNSLSQEIASMHQQKMLSRDTWNHCDRKRWVTSWTLSLNKPFWLLVHARYDLSFPLRYVMIAIRAATPGELLGNHYLLIYCHFLCLQCFDTAG